MAGAGGAYSRSSSQPQEKGWEVLKKGGWSLGGSLSLSKLRKANEMRGPFWVTFSLSRRLQACVMRFGKMGPELEGILLCAVSQARLPPTQWHWIPMTILRSRSALSRVYRKQRQRELGRVSFRSPFRAPRTWVMVEMVWWIRTFAVQA